MFLPSNRPGLLIHFGHQNCFIIIIKFTVIILPAKKVPGYHISEQLRLILLYMNLPIMVRLQSMERKLSMHLFMMITGSCISVGKLMVWIRVRQNCQDVNCPLMVCIWMVNLLLFQQMKRELVWKDSTILKKATTIIQYTLPMDVVVLLVTMMCMQHVQGIMVDLMKNILETPFFMAEKEIINHVVMVLW